MYSKIFYQKNIQFIIKILSFDKIFDNESLYLFAMQIKYIIKPKDYEERL